MGSRPELRIVFMGTPQFSVPSLEALIGIAETAGHTPRLVGIFTQPDRPAGRGQNVSVSPVKALALAAGLPVYQPEKLRRPEALTELASLKPDLIVVAAYAQILSQRVLELPRYGCLNVHGSLLPRYRGASPIQAAILDGSTVTGLSIMLMDVGLDTGPVLAQVPVPIELTDTSDSLGEKLAVHGARLLATTIPKWVAGEIDAIPQQDDLATVTHRLKKSDGEIDWSAPAIRIACQVRAMYPWPSAYSRLGDMQVKVLAAVADPDASPNDKPGTLHVAAGNVTVTTGSGVLILERVQPAGKRAMPAQDWLRGMQSTVGSVFHSGTDALSLQEL